MKSVSPAQLLLDSKSKWVWETDFLRPLSLPCMTVQCPRLALLRLPLPVLLFFSSVLFFKLFFSWTQVWLLRPSHCQSSLFSVFSPCRTLWSPYFNHKFIIYVLCCLLTYLLCICPFLMDSLEICIQTSHCLHEPFGILRHFFFEGKHQLVIV